MCNPDGSMRNAPGVAERAAIPVLRGVGGDLEWWWWNGRVRVGHLRVGLTEAEAAGLPEGCAVADAGESGPLRRRTRRALDATEPRGNGG